jgi:PHD/YefM family antitoxin component YafN of YafNO toxin-antitoxin module
MKTIQLDETRQDLISLINLARQEPLLLLTAGGEEFVIALADDFELEVEALRRNQEFQRFLDERAASNGKVPLSDVESEIDRSIADLETNQAPPRSSPPA